MLVDNTNGLSCSGVGSSAQAARRTANTSELPVKHLLKAAKIFVIILH